MNANEAQRLDVKIFASNRIDMECDVIADNVYFPVRCGAVYDQRENPLIAGDDTGVNISERRNSFCELTVQYWAWKNVEADYYGLCHYRRYLSFSDNIYPTKNGFIEEKYITPKAIEEYGLDEQSARKAVEGYDVVTMIPVDVREMVPNIQDLYGFCKNRSLLFNLDDITLFLNTIRDIEPEYYKDAKRYYRQPFFRQCNLFVMKKELFHRFCDWQFRILFELENRLDTTYYSETMQRELGFFGEHLYGIWLQHQIDAGLDLRIKEVQAIRFSHPERKQELLPPCEKNNIPIVFTASNLYVPYLSVCIRSILEQGSALNTYDVLICQKGISKENQEKLCNDFNEWKNLSLRFVDVPRYINNVQFFVASPGHAEESYYRILTPWILNNYEKAVILDADLIVKRDIADLFALPLKKGDYLGAVQDFVYKGILNLNREIMHYTCDVLKLSRPYEYVSTGVVLMDLATVRKDYDLDEIIKFCVSNQWKNHEEDVINACFFGKITFFDSKWNYRVQLNATTAKIMNAAPSIDKNEHDIITDGIRAWPYVIHWAGKPKPWDEPTVPFSSDFWNVAKNGSFYEELFARLCSHKTRLQMSKIRPNPAQQLAPQPAPKKNGLKLFLKYISMPLFPLYSCRRELVKEWMKKLLRKPNKYATVRYFQKHHGQIRKYRFASRIPMTHAYEIRKKIESLKDIHKGQRCFFVGLGPSQCIEDLEKLQENGEITFAVNKVFPLFSEMDWRPTYYLNQEFIAPNRDLLLGEFQQNVELCDFKMSFLPLIPGVEERLAGIKNPVYLPIKNDWIMYYGGQFPMRKFSADCAKEVNAAYLSMYTLFQLAVYMGFKEIYLTGVDGKYEIGKLHCYGKNELDDKIYANQQIADVHTKGITLGFEAMKFAAQNHNVKVFNATRGGYLELFPRVDLDELFEKREEK